MYLPEPVYNKCEKFKAIAMSEDVLGIRFDRGSQAYHFTIEIHQLLKHRQKLYQSIRYHLTNEKDPRCSEVFFYLSIIVPDQFLVLSTILSF